MLSTISDPFDKTIGEILDDVPEWIDDDVSIYQLQDIVRGGCASGAYMPAVTYHKALDTMGKYGDEVLDYIQEYYELPTPDKDTSWAGLACMYLSLAVEIYAGNALSQLEIEY